MDKVRELITKWRNAMKVYADCEGYEGDNHGDSRNRGTFETLKWCADQLERVLADPVPDPSKCTCEYPDSRPCLIHSPVTTFSAQQLIDEWRKVNLDPKLTSTSLFSEDWFAAYADRLNSLVRAVPAFSEEQVRSCWRGDEDGYPDFKAMTVALNALLGAAPPAEVPRHIGWIAGHCSDPVNCPICKADWTAPSAKPIFCENCYTEITNNTYLCSECWNGVAPKAASAASNVKPVWRNEEFQDRVNAAVDETQESALASQPLPSPLPMPTIQARPVNEFPTGFPVHEVPSALVRGLPYKIKR